MKRRYRVVLALLTTFLTACSIFGNVHDRFAVCSYDHAWDAALDVVRDRAVAVMDKEQGVIETGWLEIPMPGRKYGVLQREMADSKDRSRLILNVKRLDDVTKISFSEERQRWAFRGGSRLFGWASADPSEETVMDIQTRLNIKLKEHGCTLT